MIKYRPHKGLLDEAMKESKEFDTINKMYEHILLSWNNQGFGELFTKEDLSVGENLGELDKAHGYPRAFFLCNSFKTTLRVNISLLPGYYNSQKRPVNNS